MSSQKELETLLRVQPVAGLATLNERSEPYASLCPFVFYQGSLYFLISELASHTRNILRSPAISLCVHETPVPDTNPFALKRLLLQGVCSVVSKNHQNFAEIIETMKDKSGPTVQMLTGLKDFHLVQFAPEKGRLILGFGQAFEVDCRLVVREGALRS